MLHNISQCRILDAHMSYQICVGLGWCYLLLVDDSSPKCKSLCWWCHPLGDVNTIQSLHTHNGLCMHALDDDACRCTMSLARCTQTTSHVWSPLFMLSVIRRCRLDDAYRPWLMSPSWCAHANIDSSRPWLMLPTRCWLANARNTQQMSPNWCAHAMNGAYTTLLFLHIVGRCHLTDARRIQSMLAR